MMGLPTTTVSVTGYGTGLPHRPQNSGIATLRFFINHKRSPMSRLDVWYMSVSPTAKVSVHLRVHTHNTQQHAYVTCSSLGLDPGGPRLKKNAFLNRWCERSG